MRWIVTLILLLSVQWLFCQEYFRSEIVRSATVNIGSTKTVKIGKNVHIGGGVKGEHWYLETLDPGATTIKLVKNEPKKYVHRFTFDEHFVLQIAPSDGGCTTISPNDLHSYTLNGDTLSMRFNEVKCAVQELNRKRLLISSYKKNEMIWKSLD